MVRSKVNDDFNVLGMSGSDKILEIGNRAVSRVGLLEISGPIAVISGVVNTGIIDDAVDILNRLGDPDGGNAHSGKIAVVDLVDDSLPVTAAVQSKVGAGTVKGRPGRVVGSIAVGETVSKNLIDDIRTEILLVGYRSIRGRVCWAKQAQGKG